MMLFQWLTIPVLGLLFVLECVGVVRRGRATWIGVLRSIIWLAAATAIAYPDLTGVIANAVAAALAIDVSTRVGDLNDEQMAIMHNKIQEIEGAIPGESLAWDSDEIPLEIRDQLSSV